MAILLKEQVHRQQTKPTQANIIQEVLIEPETACVWIDALADVARRVRISKDPQRPISIGEDVVVAAAGGAVILSAQVAGESMEMTIPAELWQPVTKK